MTRVREFIPKTCKLDYCTPENRCLECRINALEKADAELREAIIAVIGNSSFAAGPKADRVIDLITSREASLRADYEAVLADKRRLVRELDVALHGEAGAAKQASLCDLIEPAKALRAALAATRAELAEARAALKPFAAVAEHDLAQDETDDDLYQVYWYNRAPHITVGHLRRARAALEAKQ